MSAKWLTADVRISELIMEFRNFAIVNPDAFATSAFQTVQNMTINFGSLKILQKGVFNGFDSLRSLVFLSSAINGFSNGCLDSVASTLEYLELIEWSSFSSPLQIDGLTGAGADMTALKSVKITHNLESTITERSFVGLTSITLLDLSFCRIQSIGPKAFDAISNTIEELFLNDNLLVTLPAGLFDKMLPRTGIRVMVNNNRWNCDCDLCYFKWLLVNSAMFDQASAECRTPDYLRFFKVDETDFCFDDDTCNDFVPNPVVTPEEDTTALETTTYDSSESVNFTIEMSTTSAYAELFFTQKCYADDKTALSETIFLKKTDYELKVMDIEGGKVVVIIEDAPKNSVLIWYDSDGYNAMMKSLKCNDCNGTINCRLCGNSESAQRVVIANLNVNKAYVFCLVNKELSSLPPLSCVPHFVMSIEVDQNIVVVGFLGYGMLVSILLILSMSYVLLRQNTRLKQFQGQIGVEKCQLSESSKC